MKTNKKLMIAAAAAMTSISTTVNAEELNVHNYESNENTDAANVIVTEVTEGNVTTVTTTTKKELNMQFASKEEADKALASFNTAFNGKGEVKPIRNTEKDVVSQGERQKFYSEESANTCKASLEKDDDVSKVEATISTGSEKTGNYILYNQTGKVEVTGFESKTKAEDFIKELSKTWIVSDVDYIKEKETVTVTFASKYDSNVFEEKDDADTALANFIKTYGGSGRVVSVRDISEDNSSTSTLKLYSAQAADDKKVELEKDTDSKKVTVSIAKGTEESELKNQVIETKTFDTLEKALAYIKQLQDAGYKITNADYETLTTYESIYGDSTVVKPGMGGDSSTQKTYTHFDIAVSTNRIDMKKVSNGVEKKITNASLTVTSVKIDDKNINMSSYATQDPNTKVMEYTSNRNQKLKFTSGKSTVTIIGKYTYVDPDTGRYVTKDYTVSGILKDDLNICGQKYGANRGYDLEFTNIYVINDKVVIDTNIETIYKVSGSYDKTVTTDVWNLTINKVTKGYDYKVEMTSNGSEVVETGKYTVKADAKKEEYVDVWYVDSTITTKGYDYQATAVGEEVTSYQIIIPEITPEIPKTGIQESSKGLVAYLSGIVTFLALAIRKLFR